MVLQICFSKSKLFVLIRIHRILSEDKPKTGRPPKLSEEIALRIRKILFESKQGWTTKQVEEDMIMKEGEVKYHYTHIYRLLHKWGFKQRIEVMNR
jgi:transposase